MSMSNNESFERLVIRGDCMVTEREGLLSIIHYCLTISSATKSSSGQYVTLYTIDSCVYFELLV